MRIRRAIIVSVLPFWFASSESFAIPNDFNQDGDIDLGDWSMHAQCLELGGPNHLLIGAGPCTRGDANADNIFDLRDSAAFQQLFGTFAPFFVDPHFWNTRLRIRNAVAAASTADFDHDGDADLVMSEYQAPQYSISIHENVGNGRFVVRTVPSFGTYAKQISCPDLDGDGDHDVAILSNTGGAFYTMRNNGHFSFTAPVLLPNSGSTAAFETQDFDADGDSDLALAQHSTDRVAIYRNTRNGSFSFLAHYNVGDGPVSLAVADLDLDGDSDIAIANVIADDVVMLRNNGSAVFTLEHLASTPTEPSSIRAGDVDGDADIDLVLARLNGGPVRILKNLGDLAFSSEFIPNAGSQIGFVSLTDFDSDGDLDIVGAPRYSDFVALYKNDGAGTYSPPHQYIYTSENWTFQSLSVDDLNGDGKPDAYLATTGTFPNEPRKLLVLYNGAQGAFAANPIVAAGAGPYAVSMADLDGDTDAELLVTDQDSNTVNVHWSNGDATFAPPASVASFPGPSAIATGDWDGDGDVDLVIGSFGPFDSELNCYHSAGGVRLFRNNGNGSFSPGPSLSVNPHPRHIALVDLDGDNDLDIASINRGPCDGLGNYGATSVCVFINHGNGMFAPVVVYAVSSSYAFCVGRVNADQYVDIVVSGSDPKVLFNNGNGTFGAPVTLPVTAGHTFSVALIDVDEDNDLDLAAVYREFEFDVGEEGIVVMKNQGDGTFTNPETHVVGIGPSVVIAPSLGHAGRKQLVVLNQGRYYAPSGRYQNPSLALILPSENPAYGGVEFYVGYRPRMVTAGDVDGDGDEDLAVLNEDNEVVFLLNKRM